MRVQRARDSVSAVIPTKNRPEAVVRAVESALSQTHGVCEVVVVVDGPDPTTTASLDAVADPRLIVLHHPASRGPSAARNTGIQAASGAWIALLDDDDYWSPSKLERQMAVAPPDPEDIVISCAVEWVTDTGTRVWPTRSPRKGEPIGEYLFTRTHAGEGFLATPTLLLPRDLAVRVPFPEHLRIHEDFAWLLSLEQAGAAFRVVLDPLVRVDAGSDRDSLSSQHDWHQSLAWALSQRGLLGARAFSSFCLTEAARATRGARRVLPAASLLLVALTGRPRSRDLMTFAGLVLVPAGRQTWVRDHLRKS